MLFPVISALWRREQEKSILVIGLQNVKLTNQRLNSIDFLPVDSPSFPGFWIETDYAKSYSALAGPIIDKSHHSATIDYPAIVLPSVESIV